MKEISFDTVKRHLSFHYFHYFRSWPRFSIPFTIESSEIDFLLTKPISNVNYSYTINRRQLNTVLHLSLTSFQQLTTAHVSKIFHWHPKNWYPFDNIPEDLRQHGIDLTLDLYNAVQPTQGLTTIHHTLSLRQFTDNPTNYQALASLNYISPGLIMRSPVIFNVIANLTNLQKVRP